MTLSDYGETAMLHDPARDLLSTVPREPVIVWAHAADVSRDGPRHTIAERGLRAYVGLVQEVHPWGAVVGSPFRTFWWSTTWDLIEWAGLRRHFP